MATEEAKTVGSMPPPPAYYKLFEPKATTAVDGGERVRAVPHCACIPLPVYCLRVFAIGITSTSGVLPFTLPADFARQRHTDV